MKLIILGALGLKSEVAKSRRRLSIPASHLSLLDQWILCLVLLFAVGAGISGFEKVDKDWDRKPVREAQLKCEEPLRVTYTQSELLTETSSTYIIEQ